MKNDKVRFIAALLLGLIVISHSQTGKSQSLVRLTEGSQTDAFRFDYYPGTITEMKVYPNPSAGRFNIAMGIRESGYLEVKVYDLQGRLIQSENIPNFKSGYYHSSIDLRNEPDGIYLVKAEINGNGILQKYQKGF